MLNTVLIIENYLKKKLISKNGESALYDKLKNDGYKECILDLLVLIRSLEEKNETIEHRTLVYVGIISLIKKELLNFFQISFSNENYLTSKTTNFSDEELENLIEKIYTIVVKNGMLD